ncbi:RNA polymerase sigma-70 factor (ECF subfamily) [Haloactinopolyspora alba]|uniref:RNA polymerase sigma-70 factor (ECF subfamily) n=1 Tax=Haloactinopolyspora alba TaxID=648780 RepID=A0A2P8E930_9ACTN|nr:RNA polymerase sigma factor SigJ [Haloactinopolyspora alba]PSL05973.1 RNA polymerase sigma-70 factor (ECF subfamily) [Haloactinopolyspora alba]
MSDSPADHPTRQAAPADHAPRTEDVPRTADAATRTFVEHRRLLFSVVYNMLGSVSDAEEVLQEAWLAWSRHNDRLSNREIENPRAYLVRVAVNQALAQKAVISRRRETYVGPWLPEPLVSESAADTDVADEVLRAESVSMALLVVLETLSPVERAVFVLHEAFGYAHTEIADILDRTPDSVRQIAHRAREHVHARRPRYQTEPATQEKVTERFIAAALGGDLVKLMDILAPDVTLWADGGGKALAAAKPLHGRDKVARMMAGFASRPAGLDMRFRRVNDDLSVLLFTGDTLWAVLILDLTAEGDQVREIYSITNPDKLRHIAADAD